MEGGGGGSGLISPTPDDDTGMVVDGVSSEMREQALGLISDAQTAGDRREKEALLKQVSVGKGWGGLLELEC